MGSVMNFEKFLRPLILQNMSDRPLREMNAQEQVTKIFKKFFVTKRPTDIEGKYLHQAFSQKRDELLEF